MGKASSLLLSNYELFFLKNCKYFFSFQFLEEISKTRNIFSTTQWYQSDDMCYPNVIMNLNPDVWSKFISYSFCVMTLSFLFHYYKHTDTMAMIQTRLPVCSLHLVHSLLGTGRDKWRVSVWSSICASSRRRHMKHPPPQASAGLWSWKGWRLLI